MNFQFGGGSLEDQKDKSDVASSLLDMSTGLSRRESDVVSSLLDMGTTFRTKIITPSKAQTPTILSASNDPQSNLEFGSLSLNELQRKVQSTAIDLDALESGDNSLINPQSIENIITNDVIYVALLLINLKWKLSEKEDTIFREWITQGFEPDVLPNGMDFCDNVRQLYEEGLSINHEKLTKIAPLHVKLFNIINDITNQEINYFLSLMIYRMKNLKN